MKKIFKYYRLSNNFILKYIDYYNVYNKHDGKYEKINNKILIKKYAKRLLKNKKLILNNKVFDKLCIDYKIEYLMYFNKNYDLKIKYSF